MVQVTQKSLKLIAVGKEYSLGVFKKKTALLQPPCWSKTSIKNLMTDLFNDYSPE